MNDIAIRVENLGKQYRIGGPQERYKTLRDTLATMTLGPVRALQSLARRDGREASDQTFWALKDVSFEVGRGEVVGIIGRNGAGKSTLLKVLSRITEPSEGRIGIHGRVGSLLEVGTGFHPELTGRENIYLNGAILGMPRSIIEEKFDEIVDFAEVGKFIDTPVKRYSSGMYLKMAFAVASHLQPEILIVDEVLAVGDATFQKKCIGKMQDVAGTGRTVLFVSHNMAAVRMLCTRAILLDGGSIVKDGPITEVTSQYLQGNTIQGGERQWQTPESAPGDEVVRLKSVRVCDMDGATRADFTVRDPLAVEIEYWVLKPNYPLNTMCYFVDEYGTTKFVSIDNLDSPWRDTERPTGVHRCTCHIPADFLNEGTIRIHVLVTTSPRGLHVCEHDIIAFDVVDDVDPAGVRGNYPREWPEAAIRPRLHWDVELVDSLG